MTMRTDNRDVHAFWAGLILGFTSGATLIAIIIVIVERIVFKMY